MDRPTDSYKRQPFSSTARERRRFLFMINVTSFALVMIIALTIAYVVMTYMGI